MHAHQVPTPGLKVGSPHTDKGAPTPVAIFWTWIAPQLQMNIKAEQGVT
jgi:hypothetical protein